MSTTGNLEPSSAESKLTETKQKIEKKYSKDDFDDDARNSRFKILKSEKS